LRTKPAAFGPDVSLWLAQVSNAAKLLADELQALMARTDVGDVWGAAARSQCSCGWVATPTDEKVRPTSRGNLEKRREG